LSSKSGSQFPAVVILDSEEDEDNEDLMSGIDQDEFECNPRQIERQVRAHSSVSAYDPDVPDRPDTGAPTHYDPSIRFRRNWPSWAEKWNSARLRQREGRRRYYEAHPNNNWLLRDIDEVCEVDSRDGGDVDSVLESIEHDYDPDEYDVERIMGERRRQGTHEFLVQWVGWEEMDWIPVKDCFCPDLIEEFRSAQRARRANLLATPVDGQESEAESLQQLTDAARVSVEIGNAPNPSRLRHRDKKGRFARNIVRGNTVVGDNAVVGEPVPMEIDDHLAPNSDDGDDFGTARSRIHRSNTAIRSRSRHNSVFWHTPQEQQDGEILWVRSRTITPDSSETLAGDEEPLDLESAIEDDNDAPGEDGMEEDMDEDIDEDMEEDLQGDLDTWRSSLAAMEHAEMERRKTQEAEELELQLQAQREWAEQEKERQRLEQAEMKRREAEEAEEKQKQLEMELRLHAQRVWAQYEKERQRRDHDQLAAMERTRYETEQQKKQEKLMGTVRSGSQQRRSEEDRQAEHEEAKKQKEIRKLEKQHEKEEQRRAEEAEAEKQAQIQRLEQQRLAEEQRRADEEEAEKLLKKEIKEQWHQSRGKSNPPVKQERNKDHRKHSRFHKHAVQDRLADASAAAQEKVPRRHSFSKVSKIKRRHDRSSSSVRRSEVGDTLRMALERERNAAAPSVIRPEFVRSMNAKQHEELISRARKGQGPSKMGRSHSSNVPLPSIEK
jgi:hypothetical protein